MAGRLLSYSGGDKDKERRRLSSKLPVGVITTYFVVSTPILILYLIRYPRLEWFPPPTEGLEVIDENRVTYGTLNFLAMVALSETRREREQELSANNHDSSDRFVDKDSRERKTSTSLF